MRSAPTIRATNKSRAQTVVKRSASVCVIPIVLGERFLSKEATQPANNDEQVSEFLTGSNVVAISCPTPYSSSSADSVSRRHFYRRQPWGSSQLNSTEIDPQPAVSESSSPQFIVGEYCAYGSRCPKPSHFHPLGYVLVVMLGAGVAERSGLFATAMRAGVREPSLLTPLVVLACSET